jgi:hypothetical protein
MSLTNEKNHTITYLNDNERKTIMATGFKYCARVTIGGGGSWAQANTKEEAVKNLIHIAHEDWRSLLDIKKAWKAGEMRVAVFEDGGTDSWDDDTYLETWDINGPIDQ